VAPDDVVPDDQPDRGVFGALFEFCRACGTPTDATECPACETPTTAPTRSPIGLLGARVGMRRRLRTVKGTVVRAEDGSIEVLFDDGTTTSTTQTALSDVVVAKRSGAYFPPSEMLKVARSGVAGPIASPILEQRCLGLLDDIAGRRGLLIDVTGLGIFDLVVQLGLTRTELAWWRVATLVEAGEVARASRELIDLEGHGYALRLAVWARALVHERLSDIDGRRIGERLGHFRDLGGVVAVAAQAVNDRLARSLGRTRDLDGLLDAVKAQATVDPRWTTLVAPAENLGHPLAQLLFARETGRFDPAWGPEILDRAPPALLDDLVDRGALPPPDRLGGLAVADAVHARLDGQARTTQAAQGERDAATLAGWIVADVVPNELARLARDGLRLGYGHEGLGQPT
jgi:hypothetical protein